MLRDEFSVFSKLVTHRHGVLNENPRLYVGMVCVSESAMSKRMCMKFREFLPGIIHCVRPRENLLNECFSVFWLHSDAQRHRCDPSTKTSVKSMPLKCPVRKFACGPSIDALRFLALCCTERIMDLEQCANAMRRVH